MYCYWNGRLKIEPNSPVNSKIVHLVLKNKQFNSTLLLEFGACVISRT